MNYKNKPETIDVTKAYKSMNYPMSVDVAMLFGEMNGLDGGEGADAMKTEFVVEDGLFLKRVVITMWVLLIFNYCCLLAPARLRESSSGSGETELATAQPRD